MPIFVYIKKPKILKMKKLLLFVAVASFALASTAQNSITSKDADKKKCNKESKSCCKKDKAACCKKGEEKACCKKDEKKADTTPAATPTTK